MIGLERMELEINGSERIGFERIGLGRIGLDRTKDWKGLE